MGELEEGDAAAANPEEADLLGPDFVGWHQEVEDLEKLGQSPGDYGKNIHFQSKSSKIKFTFSCHCLPSVNSSYHDKGTPSKAIYQFLV